MSRVDLKVPCCFGSRAFTFDVGFAGRDSLIFSFALSSGIRQSGCQLCVIVTFDLAIGVT